MRRLDKSTFKELFNSIENILFDCDGVLWRGPTLFDKAPSLLNRLAEKKNIFYITNNSSRTRAQYVTKIGNLGFPCSEDRILCTAHASAWFVKQRACQKVYLVGNKKIAHELNLLGVNNFGSGLDVVAEDFEWSQVLETPFEKNVDCVLVGFDPHLSYIKMVKAATYLKHKECLFVATNPDMQFPLSESVSAPGTGSIVAAVSTGSRREPDVIVGKPERYFFDMLHELHGIEPASCLMVGDNLATDIKFAHRNGAKSLFVLTGIHTLDDVVNCNDSEQIPDFYVDSITDLDAFL